MPNCADKGIARLSSDAELGCQLPTSILDQIDFVDFVAASSIHDPGFDHFMEECGSVDPILLAPPREICDLDDNHDLAISLSPAGDDILFDPLLDLPSNCSNMELLMACANQADPASRSLHNAQHLMNELDINCSDLQQKLHAEEASCTHGRWLDV